MKQNRHWKALELDKILIRLSEHAVCEDTRSLVLDITPASDLSEVQRRCSCTSDAHMLMSRFGLPQLRALQNCSQPLKKAQAGGMLSLRELLDILHILQNIRSVQDWRRRCDAGSTSLEPFFSRLTPQKELEDQLLEAIESEERLSDRASPELADIRRKIRNAGAKIREQLNNLIHSSTYQKYLQEQIVTTRGGRFVVPVKSEYRGEVKGLVHDMSASGATVFIEPLPIVEANNEIRVLESKERQETERIIYALSAAAGSYCESIETGYDALIALDMYFAKARFGDSMNAVVPELSNDGRTILKKARHPLIAPDKVVPTDIMIGEAFDTLVITGPNTGGKTVALKTIGLLTLMAMCGLMIPASQGSAVSVFERVLADIGDEQSIEQNLSTFSSHMTNIVSVLAQADSKTLVLLDELGAGTDPVEGAALAVSIIQRLRERGARVIATTHYAEIKAFALKTPGVENASCEFDVVSLRPTYRLLIGIPGRSNAFEISRRLGLDEEIIARAKLFIDSDSARFEDVVQELEELRLMLEREREQERGARERAEKDAAKIEEYRHNLERERESELEKARAQARRLVEQIKYESKELINELEEIKKQKDSEQFGALAMGARAKGRAKLRELESAYDPVNAQDEQDEGYVLPRPLKEGDAVRIKGMVGECAVLSDPDGSGYVMLRAGMMKTRVKIEDVRLLERRSREKRQDRAGGSVSRSVKPITQREGARELDIRGRSSDEALLEVDSFIDECVMSNIPSVTIIHGKGMGVLRAAVQAHLRSHPSVRTYRSGVYGEGENGVTIAELK